MAELHEDNGVEACSSRVFSRVGLLGNPSDGYGGRCISFSLANFSAEVRDGRDPTAFAVGASMSHNASFC